MRLPSWWRGAALVCLGMLLLAGSVSAVPIQRQRPEDPFKPGCITSGAPRDGDGVINVHIVSHSHDDVGWLKTVDQYFYGANNSIQHAGVQYILDTVVAQCMMNPDRKFTYVEMAFFQRWWNEQTPHMRDIVKGLVASQQLQFINGGWSMHDELSSSRLQACTHYVSMIENTAFGHRFLKEELDYVPRVGWQIDPFGHSAAQAALLSAEVGFDALYFARIDWQEAKVRTKDKSMEMVWRASASLGAHAEVFTGAFLDGGYGPPPGFDFDGMPVMDDECLADENSAGYVERFVEAARRYAGNARGEGGTKNVMFLMGSDFQYENADAWFNNLDKIIHHVNRDGRVNAFYSTPAEYTRAKFRENRTWSLKTDDFFPLADSKHSYWSGFFSSRPCLKRFERVQAGYLQGARQIQLLAGLAVDTHVRAALRAGRPWFRFWHGIERHDMDPLAAAVSLVQHHDAVSGTEMQHVAYDYAMRLAAGGAVADLAALEGLRAMAGLPAGQPLAFCKLLNESVCLPAVGARALTVLVYNPLSTARVHTQRIPVASPAQGGGQFAWAVRGAGGAVPSAVLPATATAGPQQRLQNAADASKFELVFQAPLQPFALHAFTVHVPAGARASRTPRARAVRGGAGAGAVEIGNGRVRVGFDQQTGLLSYVARGRGGPAIALSHNMLWYRAADSAAEQASGAYIFRPNSSVTERDGSNAECVGDCTATLRVVRTALVEEAVQVFGAWATQTVRVHANRDDVEIEWTVGAIPIEDGLGKEVISRFSTNISSGGAFLTDSNGRDMLRRRRCQTASAKTPDLKCRPSVPAYMVTEPVAGNYFPVNAQIAIADSRAALAVLVDRAQGGTSLRDGQIELMVHRRLLADDNRGVAEPLNETQSISPYDWVDARGQVHHAPFRIGTGLVARGKHVLSLTEPGDAARAYRALQDEIYYETVTAIAPTGGAEGAPGAGEPRKSTFWDLFKRGASGSGSGAGGSLPAVPHTPPASLRAGVLPENVMILTVEKQKDDPQGGFGVLLRVAHRFGIDEDAELSRPATVALSQLFTAAHLAAPKSVEEMSLSANQLRTEMEENRLRFRTEGVEPVTLRGEGAPEGQDMEIALTPLQIRTFILHY